MILHRTVFHAKLGKAANVVAALKQELAALPADQLAAYQPRILTDISGRFDTVVIETVHESLATYEQFRAVLLSRNWEPGQGINMLDLLETGSNEYYTIEL